MNKNQNGFGLLGLLLVFVAIFIIAGVGWFVWQKSSVNSSNITNNLNLPDTESSGKNITTKKVKAEPITINGAQILSDTYYSLTLNGPSQTSVNKYFGKIQKINDTYLRIYPAYYINSAGTLELLGKELHAPEPVMYIKSSAISNVTPLSETDKNYQAILALTKTSPVPAVNDAYGSNIVGEYINTNRFQAIYFNDGKVYYTKLQSNDTEPIFIDTVNHVFELYNSGNSISLTIVKPGELKNYAGNDILFWENLKIDGQISKAIVEYEKAYPVN